MLVMYCGEIIKIAPYQWDDFSFENVEYLDFQSQGMKLRKKANCLSKFAFCSINEVRLYFYILLAKLI
ncbi:hypothetical protein C7M23_02182 [Bacillus subtilis]|nr:hypothetical protein C7M23_02182 [Bacillus subtilis]